MKREKRMLKIAYVKVRLIVMCLRMPNGAQFLTIEWGSCNSMSGCSSLSIRWKKGDNAYTKHEWLHLIYAIE